MKIITLTRVHMDGNLTQGVLSDKSGALCVTLENPWLGNARNVSCIPEGVYPCKRHNGSRYRGVWQICDVPNRSHILFHAGNETEETEGCVLVGTSFNGERITSSRAALNKLQETLPSEFVLVVKNERRLI